MDTNDLLKRVKYIALQCRSLINHTFKDDYPSSGNIGIFSQSYLEFASLKNISQKLTNPNSNPKHKYFELIDPILVGNDTFTHLYVRKYDDSDYGKNKGDVDYLVDLEKYVHLKEAVIKGGFKNALMYKRPGWDTIQISNKGYDVISYLSTKEMAEKVRVKFDSKTDL